MKNKKKVGSGQRPQLSVVGEQGAVGGGNEEGAEGGGHGGPPRPTRGPRVVPTGPGDGRERPWWWVVVLAGERRFIATMFRFFRLAKHGPEREVALAAAKWERRLACFMKLRLQQAGKRRLRADG
jgi:hypothetical protein